MTYYTAGTPIGLPQSFTYPNALMTELTYTARNLTKDIDVNASVLDLAYTYDTRGNLTSITNNLDPSKNQTFNYDKLNRLITFHGPWGTGSYTYDAWGNRLSKLIAGVTTNYAYINNRLTSTTGGEPFSFTYNADGDVTQMNEAGVRYSLHYDRLHNLISFNYKNGVALAQFTYDGDGMRVSKVSPGNITVYHYDKEGRVISETDTNGNLLREYVYANGKLMVRIEPNARSFYHTDPAGTPLAMTDASGKVVWRAEYKPFGEEHQITGTKENDLRFVGKEKDKETGLLYFGARYMEAMIGRFMSPDPVGAVDARTGKINSKNIQNPQRLNYYAYSLNNPYRYIDPDGKWPTELNQVHQRSIERVLGNKLSGGKIYILHRQQVVMDSDRAYSHPNLHGLRMPGQDPMGAWRIANDLVRDSIQLARELENKGQHQEAMRHLGNAIHTMQDATSPAHKGFQVWDDNSGNWSKFSQHTSREFIDPGRGSTLDAATQRAWDLFKSNKPIPKEVLPRP